MATPENYDVTSSMDVEVTSCGIAFKIEIISDNSEQENVPVENLQKAFLKFKKKRICHRKKRKREIKKFSVPPKSLNLEQKLELRNKFINRLFSYIGTPYAKRYHKPCCVYYRRKLFLDCCGLVRRVVRDLASDFQFLIGPWNQAYMYDTLPIKLPSTDELQPGDLVFVSATYFDPKRKRQVHDMVHVEVWLGDGEKTIGSRWFKGTVQVLESYQFVSKSYYNMQYHFCSVDTWLGGVCRSFCPKHNWLKRPVTPQKRSIFNDSESSTQDA